MIFVVLTRLIESFVPYSLLFEVELVELKGTQLRSTDDLSEKKFLTPGALKRAGMQGRQAQIIPRLASQILKKMS